MNAYDLTDGREPMSHTEIDYIKQLIRDLPANPLIIQLGAATGVATCAMLEARPDAVIYSVDFGECKEEFDNAKRCGLDTTRVIRVLARTQEAGPMFPYKADFLFVDAGHDYQSCYDDICAWRDKVKPGGLLAFHDYIKPPPPANNPSYVYDAVNDAELKGLLHAFERLDVIDRIVSFRMVANE